MKEFIAKQKAQGDPHVVGWPHWLRDLKFLIKEALFQVFLEKRSNQTDIWFWLFIKKNQTMNNFLKESAKHCLLLEWQLMHQDPFSSFLRVQGGHEQCYFFLIFVI
jgi:hypothetical protein